MIITINKELCVGCGHCVPFCPNEAIFVIGSGDIDHEKCKECKICISYCPMNAISEDTV